jgi:hypothetical protein
MTMGELTASLAREPTARSNLEQCEGSSTPTLRKTPDLIEIDAALDDIESYRSNRGSLPT